MVNKADNATRHDIREAVFLILYQMEISGSTAAEIIADNEEEFELLVHPDMEKTANEVFSKREELDERIAKHSPKRVVNRIAKINLIIMRIAVYEMLYDSRVPEKVAINEAIELAKKYSGEKDSAFINGVLDAVLADISAGGTGE